MTRHEIFDRFNRSMAHMIDHKDGVLISSNLDILVHTLETTDGRDKLTKIIQYVGKLILLYLKSKSLHNHSQSQNLKRVVETLSNARRCFRVGRFLGDIEDLLEGTKLEKIQGAFGLVSDISENFCWIYNVWNEKENETVNKIEQFGDFCWFLETAISLYYWWRSKLDHFIKIKINL